LPAGTHHLLVGFGGASALTTLPWGPGYGGGVFRSAVHQYWVTPAVDQEAARYDLRIAPGIASATTPDAYEGNDFCTDAPTLLTLGPTAFTDSTFDLSIDAEFDWDWFRIGGEVSGRLYLTVSSETMAVAPRVYVYQPSPGMTGPVDRMTVEALTVFGDLRSDLDGQLGMSVDTVEYYVVISPNSGANVGVSRQGEPGTYRLSFSWNSAPPPIADNTGHTLRPLARWPGIPDRRPPTDRP
jgi:hypothetical protein